VNTSPGTPAWEPYDPTMLNAGQRAASAMPIRAVVAA
jgi:hypothetical protein